MTIKVLVCPNCKTVQVPHEKAAPLPTHECQVCKNQFIAEAHRLVLAEASDLPRQRRKASSRP